MWIYVTRVYHTSKDGEDVLLNTDCIVRAESNLQHGTERILLVLSDGSDMLVDCAIEDILGALRPGTFADLRDRDGEPS